MINNLKKSSLFCLLLTLLASVALIHNTIPNSNRRFEDFLVISNALEKYKKDNNSYPKVDYPVSYPGGMPTDKSINWLPGLHPKYLSTLPIDPYRSKLSNHQYLYFSNGKDYKLIAHGAEDAKSVIKKYPNLMDPTRPTFAYGIWTEGGKLW